MTSFHKPSKKTTGAAAVLSLGMASFVGSPAFAAETSEWVDLPTVTNEGSAWVAENGNVDGSAFTTDTVNTGEASATSEWVDFESEEGGSAWVNEDGTIDNGSGWVNENLNPIVTDKGTGTTHELPEGHIGINGPGTTLDLPEGHIGINGPGTTHELPFLPVDGSTWVDFESEEGGSAWVNEDGTIDNGSEWVNENLNPIVTDKGTGT
ncbi:hypothetical protein, partial [Rothia nasimurium]|uniref:hypothetical protein n=1 Tax=Rothia nasimurium TaxID=85336 RepID=UPI001F337553